MGELEIAQIDAGGNLIADDDPIMPYDRTIIGHDVHMLPRYHTIAVRSGRGQREDMAIAVFLVESMKANCGAWHVQE